MINAKVKIFVQSPFVDESGFCYDVEQETNSILDSLSKSGKRIEDVRINTTATDSGRQTIVVVFLYTEAVIEEGGAK